MDDLAKKQDDFSLLYRQSKLDIAANWEIRSKLTTQLLLLHSTTQLSANQRILQRVNYFDIKVQGSESNKCSSLSSSLAELPD